MGPLILRLVGTGTLLLLVYALVVNLAHPPLSALGAMAAAYGLVTLWRWAPKGRP